MRAAFPRSLSPVRWSHHPALRWTPCVHALHAGMRQSGHGQSMRALLKSRVSHEPAARPGRIIVEIVVTGGRISLDVLERMDLMFRGYSRALGLVPVALQLYTSEFCMARPRLHQAAGYRDVLVASLSPVPVHGKRQDPDVSAFLKSQSTHARDSRSNSWPGRAGQTHRAVVRRRRTDLQCAVDRARQRPVLFYLRQTPENARAKLRPAAVSMRRNDCCSIPRQQRRRAAAGPSIVSPPRRMVRMCW